jgi:hypothetical protein
VKEEEEGKKGKDGKEGKEGASGDAKAAFVTGRGEDQYVDEVAEAETVGSINRLYCL